MSTNYDKFLDLFINIKNTKELSTLLNLSCRTITDYKRKYNNKATKTMVAQNQKAKIAQTIKAKKIKIDPIVEEFNTFPLFTKFNKVFLKTKFNHCVNLTENGVASTMVEDNHEFVVFTTGEEQQISIKFTITFRDEKSLEIKLEYLLFDKIIRMTKKLKPAKENYTIYSCDRNCSISFDNQWWTCRRCTFLNNGIVINKKSYEFREWARAVKTNKKTDLCIQRWVVYDMETVANETKLLVPYMISAIEFNPDEPEKETCRKLFFVDKFSDVMTTDIDKNPVVKEFRNWLFSFLAADKEAMDEGIFCKTHVFGFNNFRFDDMLLNPAIVEHIRSEESRWFTMLPKSSVKSAANCDNTTTTAQREFDYNDMTFELTKSSRNGQVTACTLKYVPLNGLPKQRYHHEQPTSDNYPIKLEFKDIRKWIPDKSLKECCKDYGIGKNSKMDFEILAFNAWIKKQDYNIDCTIPVEEACNLFLMPKKKKGTIGQAEYKEFAAKTYCKNNMISPWEMCKEYCTFDSIATKELAIKIYSSLAKILQEYSERFGIRLPSKNMFSYISPAQLAYRCFVNNAAFNEGGRRLHINDSRFARFIGGSYYGGRTDYSFIGDYTTVDGNLRYYDVTSEYPLAMMKKYPIVKKEADLIVGADIDLPKYQKIIDVMMAQRRDGRSFVDFTIFRPFDEEFNAIFQCDVFPPTDVTELITFGPMATRCNNVPLSYSNRARHDIVVNTAYLKNFIMAGFSIVLKENVYNCVFTNLSDLFVNFITFFGEAKTSSKDDDNKSQSRLYKLIINSLAGKLAQKPKDSLKETQVGRDKHDVMDRRIEDWSKSNHYLASFILGEANFMLYSTLYKLQQTNIINKIPHSERCGALLYMDTDSIVFDADLCDNVDFCFSETLGNWNNTTNYYNITWKSKYDKHKPDGITCLGKKSYMITKNSIVIARNGTKRIERGIIETKLKGIHAGQMQSFVSDVPSILQGIPKTVHFEGIVRKPIKLASGEVDIDKIITVGQIKKTLQVPKHNEFRTITCTNSRVNEVNINNNIYFVTSELPQEC